jgi:hypothetical protein
MTTIKGYKFIQSNMKSKNGNHTWELGKWYKEEDLEICKKGFHACKKPLQSLDYVYGDKWFIVEARGKIIEEEDKFVASEMRLVKEIPIDKVVKRLAIFCAKQCLSNYEKEYPNDKRPFEAIKAAEDYYDGKISLNKLNEKISAAWSAKSAAESAAWSAESAAESAAWSAKSAAESAAKSAESAAKSAESAAESAKSAESAAESAAKSAQNKYLLKLIKENLKCKK